MEPKKQSMDNINAAQRITIAIVAALVGLIVAYGFIDCIAADVLDLNGYWGNPLNLEVTWWLWAGALSAIGWFEVYWLRTPRDSSNVESNTEKKDS